jgi:hypothetical protein
LGSEEIPNNNLPKLSFEELRDLFAGYQPRLDS